MFLITIDKLSTDVSYPNTLDGFGVVISPVLVASWSLVGKFHSVCSHLRIIGHHQVFVKGLVTILYDTNLCVDSVLVSSALPDTL